MLCHFESIVVGVAPFVIKSERSFNLRCSQSSVNPQIESLEFLIHFSETFFLALIFLLYTIFQLTLMKGDKVVEVLQTLYN